MKHDVFISYSSRDYPMALAACEAIERENVRCWMAPRDIIPGADWAEAILAGINACRLLVLVFSQHAVLSPQIKREVERAVNRSMPILPIKVDQTPFGGSFEYFIMTSQWLDAASRPFEVHLPRLAQSVLSLLAATAPEVPAYDPHTAAAVRHCSTYESSYAWLATLDDGESLSRAKCGISRHTMDLESERERHAGLNPFRPPPPLFAEAELIDQIAARTRRRLWILGGGGIGKTEFSKVCTLRLAERFRDQPATAVLPVRVELKSLDPAVPCNSADRLLRDHLIPDEVGWIYGFLQAGRVAFLLDGMDELRLDRPTFTDALVKLMQQLSECVFVVTGRGESIEPELSGPNGFDRKSIHILKPITLDQATAYVEALFQFHQAGDLAAPLIKSLKDDVTFRELVCSSPLLLGIAGRICLANQALPSHPLDLIERGLEVLFEQRRSRHVDTQAGLPEDAVCLKSLSCLAAYSIIGQKDTSQASLTFSRKDGIAWLRTHRAAMADIGAVVETDDAARRLLIQLTPRTGVVGWSSRDTISFNHRVLAEFLAARWVVEVGYPRWPYRSETYTTLPDPLQRQIADFFGDYYWCRDFRGIRYWMVFLLERDNPLVLEILLRWQQAVLAKFGVFTPQAVFLPEDLRHTIIGRILSAVEMLRKRPSDDLADRTFDALIDAFGFDAIARFNHHWNLLECASRRHLQEALKFYYSTPRECDVAKATHAILPILIPAFSECLDEQGGPVSRETIVSIAECVSLDWVIANKSGVTSPADIYMNRHKLFLSEADRLVVVSCLDDSVHPSITHHLLELLVLAITDPTRGRDADSILDRLRTKITDPVSAEANLVRIFGLLHALIWSESGSGLAAQITREFNLDDDRNLQWVSSALKSALTLVRPSDTQIQNLCELPYQLALSATVPQAAPAELAALIVEFLASSDWFEDDSVMSQVARLCQEHDCGQATLGIAPKIESEGPLFPIVLSAVRDTLGTTLWDEGDKALDKLHWLEKVDPEAHALLKNRTLGDVSERLEGDPASPEWAAKFLAAPSIREALEIPAPLAAMAQRVVAWAAGNFGRETLGPDLWDDFGREVTGWADDESFVGQVFQLGAPSTKNPEQGLLEHILGFLLNQGSGHDDLIRRVVGRLREVGLLRKIDWVEEAPIDEELTAFLLEAIRARMGQSLVDGAELIRIAAKRWGTNLDVRDACLELVRRSAGSGEHASLQEETGKALIEGWPGDFDVLRVIVEAGLGSLIYQTDAWASWLIFWKGEGDGSATWLPVFPGECRRVTIDAGSVRGWLVVGPRDAARRGLPGDLAGL